MGKKKHIDFILKDTDDYKIVFRFRPRQSSCHSFNDVPPTKPEEIYKVYYSYKVFRRWKDDNDYETLFDCPCDECSVIDEVSAVIGYICEGKKVLTVTRPQTGETFKVKLIDREILPFGYGVSWTIKKKNSRGYYEVVMWNHNETGYRFYVKEEKLKEFGKYLQECCEYMLAHGNPI